MNFLKISSLVIGTSSVVGGTGAGIYYGVIKNNLEEDTKKSEEQSNSKTKFDGKLVFEKKEDNNYEMKLLNQKEYDSEALKFNSGKDEGAKYADVNKIVDISHALNVVNAKNELGSIFSEPLNLEKIKTKITSEGTKLKELFNDDIYAKLKTALGA